MKKLIIILAMLSISFITNAQLIAYKTIEYSSQGIITSVSNADVNIYFSGEPFNANKVTILGNGYSIVEDIVRIGKNHYRSSEGTEYYLKPKMIIREPTIGMCQKYYLR